MHVDKNADGHVVDQNVDRISRERLPMYLLVGGSGLNVVHAVATDKKYGRRSQFAICFGDLSFEAMLKRFILWNFDSGEFSINENLFIGDFS